MIAPVKRLLKKEVEWLAEHRCSHSHTYLEHYQCYINEAPEDSPFVEKVGYLDIESSNFKADYGYILSYAIKAKGEDKFYGRVVNPSEIRKYVFDRELMKEFLADMKNFHRVVTYYGTRFDIPFLRTRCLKHDLDFPNYQECYLTDCYYMVRNKLRLHRNSLATACGQFEIEAKGHAGIPDIWIQASAGKPEALDWIWEHNKEDCVSLELLHEKLENYSKRSKVSI